MTNVEYLLFSTFKICYDQVDDMQETLLKLRHYITLHTIYIIQHQYCLHYSLKIYNHYILEIANYQNYQTNLLDFEFVSISVGKLVAYHLKYIWCLNQFIQSIIVDNFLFRAKSPKIGYFGWKCLVIRSCIYIGFLHATRLLNNRNNPDIQESKVPAQCRDNPTKDTSG